MDQQNKRKHARQRFDRLAMGFVMSLAVVTGGCIEDDDGNDLISAQARAVLSNGGSLTEAHNAMLTAIAADPNVLEYTWDDAQGIATVTFADEHIELFQIVDMRDETLAANRAAALQQSSSTGRNQNRSVQDGRPTSAHVGKVASSALQNLNDVGPVVPGNNRALVANSLSVFSTPLRNVLSDATQPVKEMLEEVNYEVDREPLTVETFRKLNQYGVIYIEALGATRKPDAKDNNATESGAGQNNICAGAGSLELIYTTTKADGDTRARYRDDIDCRRLIVTNITLVTSEISPKTEAFLSATPNFVKHHTIERSPNSTVMFVNGMQAIANGSRSGFADWLFDNTERGAVYLGWSDQPLVIEGALKHGVNLVGLLTGSSRDKITRRDDSTMALKVPNPAFRGESIAVALQMMRDANLHQMVGRSSMAKLTPLFSGFDNPSLMPIINDVQLYQDQELWVSAFPQKGSLAVLPASGDPQATDVGQFDGPIWKMPLDQTFSSGELIATAPSGQQSRPFRLYEWEPMTFKCRSLLIDRTLIDEFDITVKFHRGIMQSLTSDRWNAPTNRVTARVKSVAWDLRGRKETTPSDCYCDDDDNPNTPAIVCGDTYTVETVSDVDGYDDPPSNGLQWYVGELASIDVATTELIDPALKTTHRYGTGANCDEEIVEEPYTVSPASWLPFVEFGPQFEILAGATIPETGSANGYSITWEASYTTPTYNTREHYRR